MNQITVLPTTTTMTVAPTVAPTVPDHLMAFAIHACAKHDVAHNIDHAVKVFDNAVSILAILALDGVTLDPSEIEVFPYIMIGHDWFDHKLELAGLALPRTEIHTYYAQHLGPVVADRIMHIHTNCSWSKRATSQPTVGARDLLRLILQDADWLEAIGDEGLQRCIEYTKHYHNPANDQQLQAKVVEHIIEKLLLMPASMNYDSTRAFIVTNSIMRPITDYLAKWGTTVGTTAD